MSVEMEICVSKIVCVCVCVRERSKDCGQVWVWGVHLYKETHTQ